ncbi:MAG: hypothetical protein NXH70_02340 [Hyphomonas sp.]|nr:hypothetical protein [Hyphomonas sp.]
MSIPIITVDEELKVANELERKYLDALANLLAKHEQGYISEEAMMEAFSAVYETVSGLVNWEDLNEIMQDFNEYSRQGAKAA